MGRVVSELKKRIPRFLQDFDAPNSPAEHRGDDDEWVNRQVICKCSNENLIVVLTRDNSEDIDESDVVLCDPVWIKCPKCSSETLLFNSIQHGYDGEYGHLGDEELEGEHVHFDETPGRVFVEYSYQGEENYEELVEEGVENAEDYFDVLVIYTDKDAVEIFECA